MTNGKIPPGQDRLEPQMTPLNLDDLVERDEARAGASVQTSNSPRQQRGKTKRAATQSPAPKAKTGGLWFLLLLTFFGVLVMAAYGYLELQRLRGMHQATQSRVEGLTVTSDQIVSQIDASGGKLQQTQSTMASRLETLDKKLADALAKTETSTAKLTKDLAAVSQQLKTLKDQQAGSIAAASSQIEKEVQAELKKFESANSEQAETLKTQQASLAKVQEQIQQLSTDIKANMVNVNQSMEILEEEISQGSLEKVRTLESQFATYMQSVDQFRQQTNASLNDLSGQVRDVQQQQQRSRSLSEPAPQSGFGVEQVE